MQHPWEVRGMGLRLSDEIAPEMYNYGHFQVLFEDGSCGWYEAGWGPMMSDTAHFVKRRGQPRWRGQLARPARGGVGRCRRAHRRRPVDRGTHRAAGNAV